MPKGPPQSSCGAPMAERRGENGGVAILKEAAIQYVDRTLAPKPNATRAYRQQESTARKLDDPSRYPPQHHRHYTRPRRLPPACRPSQRC
jgi:hypothetical protein